MSDLTNERSVREFLQEDGSALSFDDRICWFHSYALQPACIASSARKGDFAALTHVALAFTHFCCCRNRNQKQKGRKPSSDSGSGDDEEEEEDDESDFEHVEPESDAYESDVSVSSESDQDG